MKKIGISCKNERWLETIQKIDSSIFQHIELNIYDVDKEAKMFNIDYLDEVKTLLNEKNLTVSVHTIGGINIAEKLGRIRKASVDILVDTIQMAEYINAKWVVAHLGNGGFSENDMDKKRARDDLAVISINEILSRCGDTNTKIALENLYRCPGGTKCKIGSSVDEFRYIFRQISSPKVGMLYDMGHNNICRDVANDNEHFLSVFAERLIAVHVHFNNGIEDLHYGLNRYSTEQYANELRLLNSIDKDIYMVCESYTLEENIGSQKILKEYM